MTPQSELELSGNFFSHPFAELLAEIDRARLDGSLRVSDHDKKCVFYFKRGRTVFAVSNARSSRLFDILVRRQVISKDDLAKIANFANDLELTAFLQDKKVLTRAECDRLFSDQIEGIIGDALNWESGEWTFSSLARIRDGLAFEVDTRKLLLEHGRKLDVEKMLKRFRSLEEKFSRSDVPELGTDLTTDEAFVLSRANDGQLDASSLVSVSAMSDAAALQAIYTLWLGGLLVRADWQAAFPLHNIAAMRNARLELKQEAKRPEVPASLTDDKDFTPTTPPAPPQVETPITVEEYLERVESAQTHYDVLGVDVKADAEELKKAYFALARMFHPDRYHSDGGDVLRRIQAAFTDLAQAHETLKSTETRELYDYRMRKEILEREKRRVSGDDSPETVSLEQAADNFERGFELLMDDDAEASLPYLARAVHFAPKNARYHAYYGKALSLDGSQRHKAEAEMQAAVKLDPNNAAFRILLAEFFIDVNLTKRAEGELARLLAISPNNREARELLDSLKK